MASVNPLTRELIVKVVYYGPGLGGKTTTLQHVHATAKPEHRGKMVSLATPVDRTLYFDFLPLRVPRVRGMSVRLQLFTVPGQVYYNATRKLVLTGADGIVFVSDSQTARADANLESLENLRENLAEHNRDLRGIPHAFQHNKRDLPDLLPVGDLDRALNAHGAPSFGTVATTGQGVYESLEAILRLVLASVEATLPGASRRSVAGLDVPEGGLVEALRAAEAMGPAAPPSTTVIEPTAPPPSPASPIVQESTPVLVAPVAARPAPARETAAADEEPATVAIAPRAAAPPSLADLWPEADRGAVGQIESAIGLGDHARAVELCDALVARALGSAADLGAGDGAALGPAGAAIALGIDGRQFLAFRRLVRRARAGDPVGRTDALRALVLAAQVRLATA